MTSQNNTRFNAEAAAWDNNPDVHRASDSALEALLSRFPALKDVKDGALPREKGLDILEIGCGTGLLSFRIAPYAKSVLAVDAAEGMIAALESKLSTQSDAPGNIQPLCIMLEDPEDPRLPASAVATDSTSNGVDPGSRRKFDLVISHLVLHHIPDLKSLLKTMNGCLKPNGWIALTDFEDFGSEARRFHPEAKMEGVERHGINRNWFEGLISGAGFVDANCEVGWTMTKDVEAFPGQWGQKKPKPEEVDGGKLAQMDFPFLICMGKKSEV